MTDVAALGFAINSAPLAKASEGLDHLRSSAMGAEKATESFSRSTTIAASATEAAMHKLTKASNDNARAAALSRHEWTNLSRQLQDAGTMLASGSSPMQILATQGAQVYDVFASSRGGATAALREFAMVAGRIVLNPLTLIAAGAATLAIGAHSAAGRLAEMADAARQTGLSIQTYMGANVLGARVGMDTETTVEALAKAADQFQAFSRNEGAVKTTLEKLGAEFLKTADNARNAGQFIDAVGNIIRNLPRAEGMDLAEKLFGADAGRRLYESIRDGSLSMQKLAQASGDASNKLGPAAQHALDMQRSIAKAAEDADNKMLAAFGRLADPVSLIALKWVQIKNAIADSVVALQGLPQIRRMNDAFSAGKEIARLGTGGLPARQAGQTAEEYNALMRNNRIGTLAPMGELVPANARDLRDRLTSGAWNAPNINSMFESETAGASRARFAARSEKPEKIKAARLPRAPREERDPIADYITSLREARALAEADLSTVRLGNVEREKARALVEAENIARREGKALTEGQRAEIAATASATEEARMKAEEWSMTMRDVYDSARDVTRDALQGLVSALREGQNVGQNLLGVIDRIADRLLSIALDQSINGLFGRNSSDAGGSVLGQFLGGLIGKNAAGTNSWRGGLTWVGEHGPEIVNLPRGASVMSNAESMRYASQAGKRDAGESKSQEVQVNLIGAPGKPKVTQTTEPGGQRKLNIEFVEAVAGALQHPMTMKALKSANGGFGSMARR